MCVEQLEKPITYDVKQEAEKIPATEKSSEAAEGEVRKEKVVANPPASEVTITIGEALDATVLTAGNKPVEWSDAAAIQAAEVRATGRTNIMPGGVAASAQSAATLNARANSEDDKTTLAVVLTQVTIRQTRHEEGRRGSDRCGDEERSSPHYLPCWVPPRWREPSGHET
ncbi:late embryogenesis abundant protein 47-like [Brassica napus]|uniref:late embryogenesis abundant protein 47-like n=1 Tax=Brassica napus TaxID=3708 RepID=UPI00207A54C8|nr:late embryogenesis abundant protein 47-like [Brassica napus]